jgi:hypothetical protein
MSNNAIMKTIPITAGMPPEVLAQMERAVELAMTGRKDPEFEESLRIQAEQITNELTQKYGTLDIGVPAIRELRGELPE